ncbi:hypothetical protein THIOKS13330052 [Thiocapsa sp. KS1]|nr:hypothetical protein THIOKS13330052 [Thiocapsa sp. KS1]
MNGATRMVAPLRHSASSCWLAIGIATDVPWRDLTDADRAWVIEGDGDWEDGVWYGMRRFFGWLEEEVGPRHGAQRDGGPRLPGSGKATGGQAPKPDRPLEHPKHRRLHRSG